MPTAWYSRRTATSVPLTSGNWTYYKYDGLNRLTEQGTCTNKVTTSGTNVLVQHFYDSYAFRSQAGFNNSNFP